MYLSQRHASITVFPSFYLLKYFINSQNESMFIFKFFTQPHTKDTSVFVLNTQDANNLFYFLSIKTKSVKIQMLKTLEWDILNPNRLINLEIKKKSEISIDPDIHHSKVPSSDKMPCAACWDWSLVQ